MSRSRLPLSRPAADFIVEVMADEVLVYDQITHRAHCLPPAAAIVWRLCDGRSTTQTARAALDAAGHADSVDAVLAQLTGAGLVTVPVARRRPMDRSRRELIGKALVAGVVIASPVVFSIVAPSVADAASACGKKTEPCCPGNLCNIPNICKAGTCQ